ncbi:MAG: HD domain-containing protein [Ruminococcaceae bacterium]|nr:HD domain-containing protein [Oscillospiraceae bacterium]
MSKTIEAEIRAFEEMPELKKIREMARERLTEYRYLHTVEVAKRGVMLAHLYGGNSCKAYRAGLLHDFCKDMPKNEMLALIRQYIPDFEKRQCTWYVSPSLWHSKAASVYLRYELKETDEEIINAVEYHTSARAGMSLTEQIVYLADLTSDDRNYPDIAEMRRLSEKNIDEAMLYALKYIIGELTSKTAVLTAETVEAYNEYAERVGR